MRAYFGSDVLIHHLRGTSKAKGFFEKMSTKSEYALWIGVMQRAEIIFFMRDHEIEQTLSFLSQFKFASVDQHIIDEAGQIFRKWHKTKGIDTNDAILAATAKTTGGKIFTLNVKHYPMKDIVIEKPW